MNKWHLLLSAHNPSPVSFTQNAQPVLEPPNNNHNNSLHLLTKTHRLSVLHSIAAPLHQAFDSPKEQSEATPPCRALPPPLGQLERRRGEGAWGKLLAVFYLLSVTSGQYPHEAKERQDASALPTSEVALHHNPRPNDL